MLAYTYMDMETFFADNGISGYYVYDADASAGSSTYLQYPQSGSKGGAYASRYLHPHQGFFIVTEADKDLVFHAGQGLMRSSKGVDGTTFRGSWNNNEDQNAYPLVNLFAEDKEGRAEVLVVEFDRPENGGGLKARGLRSGKHLLYAHWNDEDYGAFFAKRGTERVAVRFKTFDEKEVYTLRWNIQNGAFHSMYLIDNITGVEYDMLANDQYVFEGKNTDYVSRFYITFTLDEDPEEPLDPEEPSVSPFAFFDGNQWVVNGGGHLQLVDMLGRVLHSELLPGDQNRVSLHYASGVYLLRLVNGNAIKTQKIVIH